ncbi:hypothetical protein Tco_0570223 [Tanacetum coccineum]
MLRKNSLNYNTSYSNDNAYSSLALEKMRLDHLLNRIKQVKDQGKIYNKKGDLEQKKLGAKGGAPELESELVLLGFDLLGRGLAFQSIIMDFDLLLPSNLPGLLGLDGVLLRENLLWLFLVV